MLDKYFTESEIDKLVEIGPEKVREIFHNKGGCRCKDCEELRNNAAKHLESHFYTEANQYRERERIGQIVKGAEKYPEPFNPASWTAKELLQHAMQENIDQSHYIYGLFEKVEAMEARVNIYEKHLDKVGELTKFIVETFPDEGNAGDFAVDIAIKLLKELEFQKDRINFHNEALNKQQNDLILAKQQAEYWRLRAVTANKRAEDLQNTMYETREF